MQKPKRLGLPEGLIAACGAWHVGLGLYFIFIRPALLPEDARYIGTDLATLQTAAPRVADWLDKVFMVMGGFMAGAGVLIMHAARNVMPLRQAGTAAALGVTGALTLGLMSAVNFALQSDFKWLLLGPPVAWALAIVLYLTQGME